MSRRPTNPRNPLRILRGLLRKKGTKPRLTQTELSNLIHVSVDEVKSIEGSGRRSLDSVLWPILERTGAGWNGRKWVCAFEWKEETKQWIRSDGTRPFKYSVFAYFNQARESRPSNAIEQEGASWGRLTQLFMLVPDSEWWSLMLRFYRFVEECWKEHQGDKLVEIYNSVVAPGGFGTNAVEVQRLMEIYQERVAERLARMKKVKKGRPWL